MEHLSQKLEDHNSWHGDEDLEQPSYMFRTYKIRFYGLAVIGLSNIASSINWLSVAIVPDYADAFFGGVGLTTINWFSNIFMLCYLFAGPVSSWVYDHWSVKTGLIIGSVLQLLGSWLRYGSVHVQNAAGRVALAFIGQTICSIGQPFILNISTPFAALWFSAEGRGVATMIGGLTNAIGMAIASILMPALVKGPSSMSLGFLVIACITTGCAIPVCYFPKKPKTPPSFSASSKNKYTMTFFQSLKELLTNYNYLIILVAFGILCGLSSSVTSLLTQIVTPHGISVDEAGFIGAGFIIAGIIGAIITGAFIDRTKKHKWVLKVYVPFIGALYLSFYFAVKSAQFKYLMLVCVLLGFFTFSLLPVALELSIESTFPVSESISSACLWLSSQILGLVIMTVMDMLRDENGVMLQSLVFAACISFPMCILSTFYNSPNKRLEFEERNRIAST
ncbi:Major facilitator superfamily domain-containing protein 7-a [Choanephora cucurbitarum]|uniref:Major facilitator superfamily domain-containing protein 7-a n=1 Tax=Choanephora cucurbitarum TaxID=101091 RepID=A0A1C7NIV8_9FUNG|nr:Major facilitator superfamily domain-containing protein 7-a [Choanephora cucurbitarum]